MLLVEDEGAILGNTPQIPATAEVAAVRYDATDLVTAKAGTPVKAVVSVGSAAVSPNGKKRLAARGVPGLFGRAKRPKPAAAVEPPAVDDDEDVLGATRLDGLFNESSFP